MSENITWVSLTSENQNDELLKAAIDFASEQSTYAIGHCGTGKHCA